MSLTKFCLLFRVVVLEKYLWGFGLLGEQIRAVMTGEIIFEFACVSDFPEPCAFNNLVSTTWFQQQ